MKKLIIPSIFSTYIYLFHYKEGKIFINTNKFYKNDKGKITIDISPITNNITKIIDQINKYK